MATQTIAIRFQYDDVNDRRLSDALAKALPAIEGETIAQHLERVVARTVLRAVVANDRDARQDAVRVEEDHSILELER